MNKIPRLFGLINNGDNKVAPDLLLVFYDNKLLNEANFLDSLIKNLKIPVSQNTKIYCY